MPVSASTAIAQHGPPVGFARPHATWLVWVNSLELPDVRYRSGWYKHSQGTRDPVAIAGLGIYGQALHLHRSSQTVFAKHPSQPKPLDFALEAMQRAAFDAIAEELG